MRGLAHILFFSSLFISGCAAALGLATYALLGLRTDPVLTAFIFCATLFVYNSHALLAGKKYSGTSTSVRYTWVNKNRSWLLVLSFLALAACVGLFFMLRVRHYIWLGHLVVIAVAYTLPLVPVRGKLRNLRSIPYLKVLLIAYVWSAVTVQLPLLNNGFSLAESYGFFLLYGRFLFILALAPLFDIRDIQRDREANILTLPAVMGQPGAKALSVLLLLVFTGLVVFHYPFAFAAVLMASAVAAIFVVVMAKQGRSELFYTGWADGMMLLQALLVLMVAGFQTY